MDERAAVLSANDAFYRAFEARDLDAMERVWAARPIDVCTHPGWEILRGWRAIRDSWQRIFSGGGAMRFRIDGVTLEVVGDVARVTCVENILSPDGRVVLGRVACTNLYLRSSGSWRMTLHHGSAIAVPEEEPSN